LGELVQLRAAFTITERAAINNPTGLAATINNPTVLPMAPKLPPQILRDPRQLGLPLPPSHPSSTVGAGRGHLSD
jgi:hypothetical protein